MPNYRKLGLPKLTGNINTDIQNLRDVFYQQDEQLRYLFEHLDGGNFSDEFFSSINDGIARWNTENRVELDTAGLVSEVLSAADDAFTRFEQTVQGITLTVVDSEGNETSVNLSSGKFDISFLEDQIDDAEKVATNFISMTSDGGVEVGNKSGGNWTGYRSQMLADRFCIVDDSDNELASYEANAIYLGKSENKDTVIDFNNGMVTLIYDADYDRATMNANDLLIQSETGKDVGLYSVETTKDGYFTIKNIGSIYVNKNGAHMSGNQGDEYGIDLFTSINLGSDGVGIWESVGTDNEGYIQRSYIEMWPHKLLIRGQSQSVQWVDGRDGALLRSTTIGSSAQWLPLTSAKTVNGSWEMGTYGDELAFSYATDANYNAGNNTTQRFFMTPSGDFYLKGKGLGVARVLWSGAAGMGSSQTITLSESVESQLNGIIIVFSEYEPTNGNVIDAIWQPFFIPKYLVANHGGQGFNFPMKSFWYECYKYLYVNDTAIYGNPNNWDAAGTQRGVLRYVLGV